MTISINDLLNALQTPSMDNALENTRETWNRIGSKDSFSELGLEPSELDAFLSEWVGENAYENI